MPKKYILIVGGIILGLAIVFFLHRVEVREEKLEQQARVEAEIREAKRFCSKKAGYAISEVEVTKASELQGWYDFAFESCMNSQGY